VVTGDGYILTLHRIPNSKGVADKPPVLLQHGLLCSSADWVISGPGDGLGKRKYNLSDVPTPETPGLFADDTCVYATDRKEGYVLRKLQRDLDIFETWWERCNIEINEDKTPAFYFSHRRGPPESHLTLNGWNIPFVNNVKYLGVIFDIKIT
jgi:hypothetical protein